VRVLWRREAASDEAAEETSFYLFLEAIDLRVE
jgi:hypothetical protein